MYAKDIHSPYVIFQNYKVGLQLRRIAPLSDQVLGTMYTQEEKNLKILWTHILLFLPLLILTLILPIFLSWSVVCLLRLLHIFKCTLESFFPRKHARLSLIFAVYISTTKEIVNEHDMIRKCHNHKEQANPWHRDEEAHDNHKTPGRKLQQTTSYLFPIKMIAKLECI